MSKTRGFLYMVARLMGDAQAVRGGPKKVVKRVERRLVGRLLGKLMGKLFR